MNFKKDILPIVKKYPLVFKRKVQEVEDIYTFYFDAGKSIDWEAGQHGIFLMKFTQAKKPFRVFSLASIPSEGHIEISTKVGEKPSEFKQVLLDLEPGDKISMRGPVGPFYVDEEKPRLFIAGGIGITPYRAIIRDLRINNKKLDKETRLLYLDSNEAFIYGEELGEAEKTEGISIHYLRKREQLYEEIDRFIDKYQNDGVYFVAGPKPMTKGIEKALKDKGIDGKNIKIDGFIGY